MQPDASGSSMYLIFQEHLYFFVMVPFTEIIAKLALCWKILGKLRKSLIWLLSFLDSMLVTSHALRAAKV